MTLGRSDEAFAWARHWNEVVDRLLRLTGSYDRPRTLPIVQGATNAEEVEDVKLMIFRISDNHPELRKEICLELKRIEDKYPKGS